MDGQERATGFSGFRYGRRASYVAVAAIGKVHTKVEDGRNIHVVLDCG